MGNFTLKKKTIISRLSLNSMGLVDTTYLLAQLILLWQLYLKILESHEVIALLSVKSSSWVFTGKPTTLRLELNHKMRTRVTQSTYLGWKIKLALPIRACQWRGPLNHAGKSHRSVIGARFRLMIRDPTSALSNPLQVASPDWANLYSASAFGAPVIQIKQDRQYLQFVWLEQTFALPDPLIFAYTKHR